MFTFLIFIAVLAVLVLSHEFGHFIVARKCGIKVDEFGFGFPPRIFGIRRVKYSTGEKRWHFVWGRRAIQNEIKDTEKQPGTLYSINWLPLGGFVKIKGEDGAAKNDPDSFSAKAAWQKASVIVAGVVMNFLLAVVFLSLGYYLGAPAALGEATGAYAQNVRVHILQVLPGSPAEQAGLAGGDIVESVGEAAAPRLATMQDYLALHSGQIVKINILRDRVKFTKDITPIFYPEINRAGIGVAIAEIGTLKYPWHLAIYHGFISAGIFIKEIFRAFYLLIAGVFTSASIGGSVAGPVGVAVMTGEAARLGFNFLLQFMAMLSLNLAVLNILPIPALDGGRLFFIIINKIFRRGVSVRAEQIAHSIGFALLLVLVVAVTIKDLSPLVGALVNQFK
ncbi:MAG: M50 family metallopeptidase [Candidatus Magasanikbacteria bacterium]|nr:M50 family metallopeptidase [Candidatus Magasanikbacteria bacterium]